MPKRTIDLIVGDFYHIYNRAVTNNKLFIEERNYWFFISKIKKYLLNTTDILAYCLMPNHYHLVVKLRDINLPTSMQRLAMSYTGAFNKVYGRSGHLFQGRYQMRLIHSLKHLVQVVNYIHLNPCSAGLTRSPEERKLSSYLEYIGERNVDFIKPEIVLEVYGSGNDMCFHEDKLNYRKVIEKLVLD